MDILTPTAKATMAHLLDEHAIPHWVIERVWIATGVPATPTEVLGRLHAADHGRRPELSHAYEDVG